MGGTRVYKRLNDGAAIAMSIKVAQQEAKTNSVSKRRGDFIFSIRYSAMHDMSTGLGCSVLVQTKEACRASLFGIWLFGWRISI